jgi:hypothetical protein
MSEMDTVNAIIDYIELTGGVAIRINAGMRIIEGQDGKRRAFRGAPKGTSDILACIRGQFIAIECKDGRGKPTPEQVEFLERVRSAGGIGLVAWSLDDVIMEIEGQK